MTENYNFKIEIKQIMIALGDSFNPLEESISLMETVVLDYLENILQETCRLRKTNTIRLEQLLLLFKDDENTLGRINYYLDFADISKARIAINENDVESRPKSSLRCKSVEIEEEKKKRRIRLNELANLLTPDQYLIYSEARRARLDSNDDEKKFYHWMISNLRNSNIRFNTSISKILAYLGHELVAEIIEVILLMRKDSSSEDFTHKSTIDPTNQPPITTSEIKKAMEKITRINSTLENISDGLKGVKEIEELYTKTLADII